MINPKHGLDGVLFSSIKGYYMHSPWKYLDQIISNPLWNEIKKIWKHGYICLPDVVYCAFELVKSAKAWHGANVSLNVKQRHLLFKKSRYTRSFK